MAPIPGSVRFTGFVAPTDSTDTYAVTDETYNRGGYRTVADAAGRLAITMDRRLEGMLVKQLDTGVFWTLTGGIADINWIIQTFGAGGADTETLRFEGNGQFIIDPAVDGAWIAPAACTVSRVSADVGQRGGNGGAVHQNIWDLNKGGVTMYTTQANRPTINDAGGGGQAQVVAALPDITAIAQNDRITVDTDSVANDPALPPANFSVIIRVTY
jgi:hypothetical protein